MVSRSRTHRVRTVRTTCTRHAQTVADRRHSLSQSPSNLVPGVWTPDGRQLLYYVTPVRPRHRPDRQSGSRMSRSKGTGEPSQVRWATRVPWMSRLTALDRLPVVGVGQFQIYVDAFPGPGPRYQVSTDGGGSPIWRGDGRELYYLASAAGRGNSPPGEAAPRAPAKRKCA
jgi:hypothetical protein